MFKIQAQIDTDVVQAWRAQMDKTPALMQEAGSRVIQRYRADILDQLQRQPGPPKYPLRWKSERQRRFVMAKLRRENNLPYRRTGRLAAGWRVLSNTVGNISEIAITNNVDYMPFVQGDWAQPFHLDTGWPQFAPIFTEWEPRLQDAFVTEYLELSLLGAGR